MFAGGEADAGEAVESEVGRDVGVGWREVDFGDFFAGTVPPKTKGVIQQVTVLSADGTKVTWPPGYQGL